jgi:hypothetical protein
MFFLISLITMILLFGIMLVIEGIQTMVTDGTALYGQLRGEMVVLELIIAPKERYRWFFCN